MVAELFVSPIRANLDLAEQEKAINDAVLKIKKESLDKKAAEASDIAQLQQIIKEQSMLQKIHVSLKLDEWLIYDFRKIKSSGRYGY